MPSCGFRWSASRTEQDAGSTGGGPVSASAGRRAGWSAQSHPRRCARPLDAAAQVSSTKTTASIRSIRSVVSVVAGSRGKRVWRAGRRGVGFRSGTAVMWRRSLTGWRGGEAARGSQGRREGARSTCTTAACPAGSTTSARPWASTSPSHPTDTGQARPHHVAAARRLRRTASSTRPAPAPCPVTRPASRVDSSKSRALAWNSYDDARTEGVKLRLSGPPVRHQSGTTGARAKLERPVGSLVTARLSHRPGRKSVEGPAGGVPFRRLRRRSRRRITCVPLVSGTPWPSSERGRPAR